MTYIGVLRHRLALDQREALDQQEEGVAVEEEEQIEVFPLEVAEPILVGAAVGGWDP